MTQRLFILRHAKSSWAEPGQDDFDRPLNPRGVRAAAAMAAHAAKRGLVFDHVICSPAARTRQTWAAFAKALPNAPPPDFEETAYLAPRQTWAGLIRSSPADARSVLVVGHNPGLHELALWLAPKADVGKFPTGAFAEFELRIAAWRDLDAGRGALLAFETPKSLSD